MILHRAFNEIDPTSIFLCSVDPITITALALGGAAAFAGSQLASSSSSAPAATPAAPPATPAPQMQPATARPKPKSNTPSFIGSAVPENSAFGSKTLLGQ
jgi:hypothetical protein